MSNEIIEKVANSIFKIAEDMNIPDEKIFTEEFIHRYAEKVQCDTQLLVYHLRRVQKAKFRQQANVAKFVNDRAERLLNKN